MVVSLQKGQKVDLTKGNPGLNQVQVGLGWDTNKYDGGEAFDLDCSIFLLGSNGKVQREEDFVYFNNLIGGKGSVVHSGDNLTGEGSGDDEVIKVNLKDVPADVDKIVFTVSIYDANNRRQNFGMVSNSYIRVTDGSNELIKFDLGEDFSTETSVVAGELYRHNGEWKFNAIGAGYQGGLDSLTKDYM